jgi:hypothetical protein
MVVLDNLTQTTLAIWQKNIQRQDVDKTYFSMSEIRDRDNIAIEYQGIIYHLYKVSLRRSMRMDRKLEMQ